MPSLFQIEDNQEAYLNNSNPEYDLVSALREAISSLKPGIDYPAGIPDGMLREATQSAGEHRLVMTAFKLRIAAYSITCLQLL